MSAESHLLELELGNKYLHWAEGVRRKDPFDQKWLHFTNCYAIILCLKISGLGGAMLQRSPETLLSNQRGSQKLKLSSVLIGPIGKEGMFSSAVSILIVSLVLCYIPCCKWEFIFDSESSVGWNLAKVMITPKESRTAQLSNAQDPKTNHLWWFTSAELYFHGYCKAVYTACHQGLSKIFLL